MTTRLVRIRKILKKWKLDPRPSDWFLLDYKLRLRQSRSEKESDR